MGTGGGSLLAGHPGGEALLALLPSFLLLPTARCPRGRAAGPQTAAWLQLSARGFVVSVAEGITGGQCARQHTLAAQTSCMPDVHCALRSSSFGPTFTASALVIHSGYF